jgi:hypothetical protein
MAVIAPLRSISRAISASAIAEIAPRSAAVRQVSDIIDRDDN